MNASLFVSYLLFCVVMTCTPGPNNALVMLSGARFGISKTLPLVLGIAFGVAVQLFAIGIGLNQVFLALPQLQFILSLIGTAYILWLAWKIASSGPLNIELEQKPSMGFLQGALFQWVNPKAWMMGVNTAILFLPSGSGWWTAASLALVCIAVNLPCVAVWAVAGDRLRHRLHDPLALRAFNLSMAALLAGTALWILVEATLSH